MQVEELNMLTGIDHAVLLVADVERSMDWYREYLGLEPERVAEWRAGDAAFVSLRVNDTFIIDLFEGQPDGRNVDHLAFTTDRASYDTFVADHSDLIEMGPAQLFGAQGNGEGVYFRDPDGHKTELRTYSDPVPSP